MHSKQLTKEQLMRLEFLRHASHEMQDEDWYFLANAAYIELSKTAIKELIEMIDQLTSVNKLPGEDDMSRNPDGTPKEYLNVAGVMCEILEHLPPEKPNELQRLRVAFPNGNIQIIPVMIVNDTNRDKFIN